jgi:XTP/dITP diphosphohydrolase
MTREIVLATRNLGKVAEFERLLSEYASDITVLGLADFPDLPDVEETGTTFIENALLKSREISAVTGLPAISDDSGLCIDFLGGAPGVYSARWSGVHGDDQANIAKVLEQLAEVPMGARTAHFTCAVALSFPPAHPLHERDLTREGVLNGAITIEPRGSAGFGYDPIFQPAGYELTLGEFAHGEKDAISHRGQALRAIAPEITRLI